MGPGPFVQALEYAAGCSAEVVGKPEVAFFNLALRSMMCKPEEVAMIGDDVHADILGAQRAGMRGLLVKTGKFQEKDLLQLNASNHTSTTVEVVADFPSAVHKILSKLECSFDKTSNEQNIS